MIFALSDTHLTFNSNKPMDKFGAIWHKHPFKIKANCARQLNDNDILLLAGDLSWASKLEEAVLDLDFLDKLPGQKILLRGNHDYWWGTLGKMRKLAQANNWQSLHFLQQNAYLILLYASKPPQILASDLILKKTTGLVNTANANLLDTNGLQEVYLIIGTKGYLLPAEYKDAHDADLAKREIQRLAYSYKQGVDLLAQVNIPTRSVKLVALTHYPPLLKTYSKTVYTEFFEVLAAEFKSMQAIYGHLHGLGCKMAFQGELKKVIYHFVSADYLNFCPMIIK